MKKLIGIILLIVLIDLIMDTPQVQQLKEKLYKSTMYKETTNYLKL